MTKHNVKTIDVHQLKNKMDAQSGLYLIDVRELEEWHIAHIPGAIHIPKDEIKSRIESKIEDKSLPIYLYCRSGVRSLYAAHCLLELGYQDVYSVDGGILDWASFGYPVQR